MKRIEQEHEAITLDTIVDPARDGALDVSAGDTLRWIEGYLRDALEKIKEIRRAGHIEPHAWFQVQDACDNARFCSRVNIRRTIMGDKLAIKVPAHVELRQEVAQ